MALSIISIPGDGVTDTFNVSFALGILDRNSVTAWVTGEVDGGGNKIYRTITYLTDTMLKISGPKAGVGVMVVFTRTVSQTNLIVNYEDGDIMNETNLNTSQKQALMLVHQVLDGRFTAFIQNVSAGGFRITNLGTPIDGTDAANKAYVDSTLGNNQATAAAAAASAAAALASQNAAAASAANSLTYSNNSNTYAGQALTYRNAAQQSATDAQTANVSAYNNYTASVVAMNKAQEWSDKPEDVFVSGTTEYSAYHWSRKALGYVTGSIANAIHGATNKPALVAADEIAVADSQSSWGLVKATIQAVANFTRSFMLTQATTWTAVHYFTAGLTNTSGTITNNTTVGQAIGVTGGPLAGAPQFIGNAAAGVGNASFISLNRTGVFGAHFGIDTDNKWKVGGWSMGANAYPILHTGNYEQAVRKDADNVYGGVGSSATTYKTVTLTGTVTLTAAGGNFQNAQNTGAFTLAKDATAATCNVCTLQITNSATAGAVTISGFNNTDYGDAFDTINGSIFLATVVKIGSISTLYVKKVS